MKRTSKDRSRVAGWAKRRDMYFAFIPCICIISIGVVGWCGTISISPAMSWLIQFVLYGFIYTHEKINSISVLIRAIPGALPLPLSVGWQLQMIFSVGGWILFGIQFIWQFPHFWAIARLAHQIIPKQDLNYCLLIRVQPVSRLFNRSFYSVLMIPVGVLPLCIWYIRRYQFLDRTEVCNLWWVYGKHHAV